MPTRIPTHRPPRVGSPTGDRPSAAQRGYCSASHRRWRQAVLLRDAFACVSCGKVSPSNHADHVSPVMHGTERCMDGRSRYDIAGGQCLCQACHTRKTSREATAAN